ncbi:unnamed protein product [Closterium sp. Yama58-4]|nr:unnamed protein product [Closterium sp. Yama58-4]
MSLGGVQACDLAQRLEQQWDAARQLASDIQTAVAGFLAASVQPPSLIDLGCQSFTAVDPDCDATCDRDDESDRMGRRRHDDGASSREAFMARLRGFRWHAQVIRQQSIVLADVTFHLCDVLEASCSLTPQELSRLTGAVPSLHPDEASSNLLSKLDSPPPLLSSPATEAAAGQEAHGDNAGARETVSGSEEGSWSGDTREGEWDEREAGVVEQIRAEPQETAEGEDVGDGGAALAAWGAKGQQVVADVALMVEQELERERRREQEAVLLGGVTSPPGARPAVPASWQQPWWLSPASSPAPAAVCVSAAGWHASTGMNGVMGGGMPVKGTAGAGGSMERRTGGFAEFSGRSGVGFAAFAASRAVGAKQGDGKAAGTQQTGAGEEIVMDTKGVAGNAGQFAGPGFKIDNPMSAGKPLSPLFTLMRR